jgi:hypothetical protein
MGSNYTEIIFQNSSSAACKLTGSLHFEQLDNRGVRIPIKVGRNVAVNMDGAGSPEVMLKPHERTAITIQSANRTGYDESRRCATEIRISTSPQTQGRPLIRLKTTSCAEQINVSGFHPVRDVLKAPE